MSDDGIDECARASLVDAVPGIDGVKPCGGQRIDDRRQVLRGQETPRSPGHNERWRING